MSEAIKIQESTLVQLDKSFNIPIYQRPYAWTSTEVELLLNDFRNAYDIVDEVPADSGTDMKDYYIGNIVVFENAGKFDIVDGQQRFTTLFLIGVAAKVYYEEWKNIDFSYEIRENDDNFLKNISIEKINEDYQGINQNLINNLRKIQEYFIGLEDSMKVEFAQWIFKNVKFVITVLDNTIDVDKYFEVMNNRGIQLEKHHILKANLLSKINKEESKKYAKVWDYCSDMSTYVEEYLFKDEENENKIKDIRKRLFDKPLELFTEYNHVDQTLLEILKVDRKEIDKNARDAQEYKKNIYRSIINFETLILHVYKITINDSVAVNDSDLLKTVILKSTEDGNQQKKFIEDLLHYRILFDYFVFKRDKEKNANIRLIDNNGEVRQSKDLLMIQLLFDVTSSKFNLWLTAYLKEVDQNKDTDVLVDFLEKKDRSLAKNRKTREFQRLEKSNFEDILNQGTSTPHYWFYKLEYLLWKDYNDGKNVWRNIKILEDAKISDYKLKGLTSIEHIYPQNPEEKCFKWDNNKKCSSIDNFGNLALISNHMNSSLSNQCPNKKKKDIEKQLSSGTIESLKMLLSYSKYEEWNAKNCKEHQEDMIRLLNRDIEGSIICSELL